ncbi:MAG: hypothetical protein JWP36_2555 [Paucimonas sp.]|nr:hypothetical protein [Paucimonas sp.]
MNRFRNWSRSRLHASLLVLALLFVQSVGLLHAVSHAGGLQFNAGRADASVQLAASSQEPGLAAYDASAQTSLPESSLPESQADSRLFDPRHACASFDAATLAAALTFTTLVLLLANNAVAPMVAPALVSQDRPPACPFLSRAPPFLTA